uniref:MYND-type domain-containing protein n=1 Tax=Anopheles triannulatus TaxID=58253 RepID=A0A2M4AIM2_9DIPT
MFNNLPSFHVKLSSEDVPIRTIARRYRDCMKVYIPPNDKTTARIMFASEGARTYAANEIAKQPGVLSVTPGKEVPAEPERTSWRNGSDKASEEASKAFKKPWKTYKKPTESKQSTSSAVGEAGNSTTSGSAAHDTSKTLMKMPSCAKCFACPVMRKCFTCGTFYCDVKCQKQHWPVHKENCMPRLTIDTEIEKAIYMSTAGAEQKPQPAAKHVQSKPPHSVKDKERSGNHEQPVGDSQNQSSKLFLQQLLLQDVQKLPKKQQKQEQAQRTAAQLNGQHDNLMKEQSPSKHVALKHLQEELPNPSNILTSKGVLLKLCDPKKRKIETCSFPAVGTDVKIAHVAEDAIYIYNSGQGSRGQPNQYLKTVERSFIGGRAVKEYLIQAPSPEDIVYAPLAGAYYRAEVKSVLGGRAIVFFTDFGNTETLEWKKFKEIEDLEIKYADRLIHEVQIENVPILTVSIRKHLQTLEGEAFELSKVVDIPNSKTKIVELRHSKELYHLSEMIRKLSKDSDEVTKKQLPQTPKVSAQQVVVPTDPNSYVPVSMDELSEVCIPSGDGVELMIIDAGELNDSSHRLAVIDVAQQEAFAKLLADVGKYGKMDRNVYSPEETHHLCLVQWDGIWSRAVPLNTGSKQTSNTYCLLDLGIMKAVESTYVRRFPQALSRKLYVTECIVENPDVLISTATGSDQNPDLLVGKKIMAEVLHDTFSDGEQRIRVKSVL